MWKCEEWEKKNKKNNNTYSWNDFYGELVNQIFSHPEKREFSICLSFAYRNTLSSESANFQKVIYHQLFH